MITFESVMAIDKDALQEAARDLSGDDIASLVEWLALKDDDIRYRALRTPDGIRKTASRALSTNT